MGTAPSTVANQERYAIRPATAADAVSIARMIVVENGRPADAAEIAHLVETAPAVVAFVGDELVGMVYSRPFSPDILEWRNSLVASAHRRTGLGRLLVDAMEQQTRRAGFAAAVGVNCWKRPGGSREAASAARSFWHAMGWTIIFATDGSAVVAKHF
jgi:GNAT superfamily N-acetyltransferase